MKEYGPISFKTSMFTPLPRSHPDYCHVVNCKYVKQYQQNTPIQYPKFIGEAWYYWTAVVEQKWRKRQAKIERRRKKRERMRLQDEQRRIRKINTERRALWKKFARLGMATIKGMNRSDVLEFATPSWITSKEHLSMEKIYKEAKKRTKEDGRPFVVDHDIPLRGEIVCGLHIPENLRVRLGVNDHKKSNSFEALTL